MVEEPIRLEIAMKMSVVGLRYSSWVVRLKSQFLNSVRATCRTIRQPVMFVRRQKSRLGNQEPAKVVPHPRFDVLMPRIRLALALPHLGIVKSASASVSHS